MATINGYAEQATKLHRLNLHYCEECSQRRGDPTLHEPGDCGGLHFVVTAEVSQERPVVSGGQGKSDEAAGNQAAAILFLMAVAAVAILIGLVIWRMRGGS